jgi:TolA-binding protein
MRPIGTEGSTDERDETDGREPGEGFPLGEGATADTGAGRRELAELHAITTRTHNAVATLGASIKEVIVRQQRYERGLNLNSFVAYVLFTMLLGGGFYLLYRARAAGFATERDAAIRQRDDAVAQAQAAHHEVEERDDGAKKAAEFYQLIKEGKRAEAIARYPEMKTLHLTPTESLVFSDAVTRVRAEAIEQSFADGVEAVHAEQWKRASTALQRVLGLEDEGSRAIQVRYYLGVALVKQGDYQEAARQLEAAIAGGVERTVGGDVRFYLASALEMERQPDRARAEYLKYVEAHPQGSLAGQARVRIRELAAAKKPN